MASWRRYATSWGIAAVVVVHQLLLLLWPAAHEWVIDITIVLVTLTATIIHSIKAMRTPGRTRRVWVLGAAGMGSWAFSETYDLVALHTGGVEVRPWWVHVANLSGLALAILAMLRIPSAPNNWANRVRMALDGLLVGSALLGIAWLTILSPMRAATGTTTDAAIELAYPVLSVAVLAVALLVIAGQRRLRRTALSFLGGGISVLTLTLLVEVFANVTRVGWLTVWIPGGLLFAALLLTAAPGGELPPEDERPWDATTLTGRLVPYVPGIVLLGVATAYLNDKPLEPHLLWAAVVMISCLLGRQFLALQVNSNLATYLERQRELLAYEAFHDRLTGLPNRAMLLDRLRVLGDDQRGADPAALLMIDLDGFKAVNDTLGHGAGDELLIVTADRLRAVTRRVAGEDPVPARLGGDEFAVLLRSGGVELARTVAEAVLEALSTPAGLSMRTVTIRASIGIAVLGETEAPEVLLAESDIALYAAKASGKGRYRVFDADMSADALHRLRLQNDMLDAIRNDQLEVAYQPIVDMTTGVVTGAEALVRWRHPQRGLLVPDTFLPVARSMGILAEVDRWVLATACAQAAAWRRGQPDLSIGVNVSATYLAAGDLAGDVATVLADTGLPAPALTIEVTETALVADLEAAARTLADLRKLGVRVALDDFGVGYSSLAYLRALPIDTIKIDRSFVRDLTSEDPDTTLVATIIGLARNLGMQYIAEGVEDSSQAGLLRALDCHWAQGPFFAYPMPAEQLTALLASSVPPPVLTPDPVPAQG